MVSPGAFGVRGRGPAWQPAPPRPERRHGRAGEGPPARLPGPLQGKHLPTEELLLIRRGNDLLLGQGRRVKCFCTPGRDPAFNGGFARTALKVAATEWFKKPPEPRSPEGPSPRQRPPGPTDSGLRQRGATDEPLCPASFPGIPIPLQGAVTSPSVSHTTQNDRERQTGLFSCFHISRKKSTFLGIPASTSSLMGKEKSRLKADGWVMARPPPRLGTDGPLKKEPRGVPADVPRLRPASDPGTSALDRPPSAGARACPCCLRCREAVSEGTQGFRSEWGTRTQAD